MRAKHNTEMNFSAEQIAQLINGKIEGDPHSSVSSFGKIEDAVSGQLAFLSNPKYEDFLYTTQASIVIINESLSLKTKVDSTLIRVSDAYAAFATLLDAYQQMQRHSLSGTEQPVYVHESAKLGDNIYLGAFAYIGQNAVVGNNVKIFPGVYIGPNVTIGDHSILYAGVKIYHDCAVGSQVIIHSGTVIGSDGFGFAPMSDGTLKKVPQIGNVVIEDNVEIGANTTIDRSTMGSTIIRKGAKLDNLVQIAHNVEIGTNTVVAAQTGISGSSKVGNNVMIGGQTGIAGHLQIADGTKLNGKSGVIKSILEPNTALDGNPAFNFTSSMKSKAALRRLPELERRVRELENLINELKNKQ